MRRISEKKVEAKRIAGQRGFINYQDLLKNGRTSITLTTIDPGSLAPKPIHSHRERQLNFIIGGEATLICGGKEIDVKAGDLLIFDEWEDHSFRTREGKRLRSLEIKLSE
jgi:mannose-6-phosphate isomerase-like protein (cupin superfamily)